MKMHREWCRQAILPKKQEIMKALGIPVPSIVTFHEQQECGYGFPSLPLATSASVDVSELVFKHEWRSLECLKTILTHPQRHPWPEVVMGNHTHTSAVHGKSFHKGLIK